MLLTTEQIDINEMVIFHPLATQKKSKLIGFLPISEHRLGGQYSIELKNSLPSDIIQGMNNIGIFFKEGARNVVPIFGVEDPFYIDDIEYRANMEHVWYNSELPHKEKYTMTKEQVLDVLKYKECNPYMLFFHGSDDRHAFLRFKDEEEALTYLEMSETFDDLIQIRPNIQVI